MEHLESLSNEELEKLRMENELKKMKFILEQGAVFNDAPDNNQIHPLIENEFLNSIEAFENSFNTAKPIKVYDFINRPPFRVAEDIPDSQLSVELAKIEEILNENGIQLDTICDVDKRELYRFITEELFEHEMDDMRIPGMMTCFIYEEFHPNHEHDIREHSTNGIRLFLNKKDEFYTTYFTREAEEDLALQHFRDAYKSFTIKHFKVTDLSFGNENAKVVFDIDFFAKIEGSGEKHRFTGEGTIELVYHYDYWCIQKIQFPEMTGND